jgi:protein-tyrosine phosphatase
MFLPSYSSRQVVISCPYSILVACRKACQTCSSRCNHLDIRRKFFDLESLQNQRLNRTDENGPWHIDESSEVRARNRYSNITPWESNRIRLNVPKQCCDYINASPITLKSQKDGSVKRYIATQV